MAALGVRIFTDDGTGVQDARLMRRAMEYASGLGVVLAQHCEDASLAGGGPDARGRMVEPPRHPGSAGRGRGADGHARPGPGPPDRGGDPFPAPLQRRVAGDDPGRQGIRAGGDGRGGAPPLHPDRRRGRLLRPGVQGQPAAAQPAPTSPPSRRRWPRGSWMPSPPITPPTPRRPRSCRSTRPRPGMLGLETALGLALTELDLPSGADPGPAVLAAGRHRRPVRRARRSGRGRRRPPTSASSTRPPSGWSIRPPWPAGAATPPTPGEPWSAGPGTPSSAANRSSSTARRSDERSRPGARAAPAMTGADRLTTRGGAQR